MSIKVINLTIPDNECLPDIINSFSPEETYLMLKIGSGCLLEGRKVVAGLTQKEIYQKIRDESRNEIHGLELKIVTEKEVTKKMEERIVNMYEERLDKLTKQIIAMSEQIKSHSINNKEAITKEVDMIRGRFDLLLEQKDRQVDKLADNYEKMIIQSHKSTSHKGAEGEKTFCDYADTFKDFKGFEIIDKHTQGGEGDFHLHFEEFDVLADAKNYKKKVPNDQREKIRNDLLKNEHLHFAWLVSLNTSIEKFDKAPIMYEWINTTQCIVYINNLSSYEDPQKILRIVWFTCKELYKLIEDVNFDEAELTGLRERNFKMMDRVKNIRKTIREINTSMNTTRNLIQVMDDELKGMLDSETTQLVASNISLFDDWWGQNIETTSSETVLSSTDLWTRFKQENKILINDMNITGDKFKQYIKSKVPLSSIVLRSKNSNSAFDIKGIKMTNMENTVVEGQPLPVSEAKNKLKGKPPVEDCSTSNIHQPKIEVEFREEALKPKRVIKKKTA